MSAAQLAAILEEFNRLTPRTRLFATHALRQLTPPALTLLIETEDPGVPDFLDACRSAGVDL